MESAPRHGPSFVSFPRVFVSIKTLEVWPTTVCRNVGHHSATEPRFFRRTEKQTAPIPKCIEIVHQKFVSENIYKGKGKGKGKGFPLQARLWPRGWIEVQLYVSKTTALGGGEQSSERPGRTLPPGKTRYPFYRRLGGPQGRSGQVRKISSPTGDSIPGPSSPQSVAIKTELPGPHSIPVPSSPQSVAIKTELPGQYTHQRFVSNKIYTKVEVECSPYRHGFGPEGGQRYTSTLP